MRPRLIALALLAVCLGLPATARAQSPKFAMEVSPRVGTLSDRFTVTVEVEIEGVAGPDRYWPPTFRGFTVLESTEPKKSTFSRSDPKRGRLVITSVLRTYTLEPIRAGTLTVGPARIRIGRDEYKTDARYVTVHAGSATASPPTTRTPSSGADPTAAGGVGAPGFSPPDPDARADVFLHAVVDKTDVYVGEQVIVTWLLYTRSEVLRWEPTPPRLDALWAETLYEPTQRFTYFDARVGSTPYQVVIVAKRALFPTQPGRIQVMPFVAKVASLTTAVGQKKRVASNAIELNVKQLPEGAPPTFDPTYVGVFSVEAQADRTEIDAAESLTLTLRVRGQGAIRRTKAPKLTLGGFRFREPRDYEESVDTSNDVVRGERVYRYWTTPEKGGSQQIPSIEIPYFDPRTGEYAVARTEPIPIAVQGDPSKLADVEMGSKRDNVIAQDIRLLRDRSSIRTRAITQFHRSPWFWVLAVLPPLTFILVVVIDRVREGLKRETPRARLRRARGRAKQRFRVAEIHLKGERPAKFFGELSRVLIDHIEERVGQPVQSMTRGELIEFLEKKGFTQGTVKQIDRDLQAFDQARFAPTAASQDEMKTALRVVKELLRRIERTQLVDDPDSEEETAA